MRKLILLFCMLSLVGCKTFFAGTKTDGPSSQAIGVGLINVTEADGSPAGWVKKITVDNNSLTVDGADATIDLSGAAGGQAITFDIGDDGGDDSVDLGEIATTGDTNSIFTEPSADKMLIDLSQNWPTADVADTLSTALTHELGGLETDVSAYSGLVAISGGSTSEVDALSELNAQIADATLIDDGAIADSTDIGLAAGDTYSNYGDAADDSLNELFAAIDAAITGGDAFTVKVDAAATAGYLGVANDDGVLRSDGTSLTIADGGDFITLGVHEYLQDIAGLTIAQGDIFYVDGSGDIVNLAAGTSGKYLKTQGAGADPTWDTPAGAGDVSAVGDCASGNCFTDGNAGDSSLVFEVTDNAFETTLVASEPEQDNTVTIPDSTGTILLGPADLAADNILIKSNYSAGAEVLMQATGIAVDDSNNMSNIGTIGSGAIASTGAVGGTDLTASDDIIGQDDLQLDSDAAVLQFGEDQDVSLTHVADTGLLLNAAMQFQFRDSAIHIESADDGHLDLTADTSIDLNGTVVASGALSANNVNPDAADGATLGTTSLEWSDAYFADGSVIYFGDDQDVSMTHVADLGLQLNEAFSIADDKALTFGGNLSGYDWTVIYDETTSDALEFTHTAGAGADVTFDLNDNAADSVFTITNSDGTYEANVVIEGDLTVNGTFSVPATDDPYWLFSPTTAGESSWYITVDHDGEGDDDDPIKFSSSGTDDATPEFEFQRDGDFIAEGSVKGTAIILEGGTNDTTINAGTPSEAVSYQWPGADGDAAQVLTTGGDGTLTWETVSAAAGGADTQIQYNDSSALAGDAGLVYNATNNTVSLTQAAANPTLQSGDGSFSWGHTPQVGIEGVLEVDSLSYFDAGVVSNEDVDINFDAADEEVSILNTAEYGADGAQVSIENTDADVGAAMYLLRLRYTDDGQANADFMVMEDNNGDDQITFTDGGSITASGTITSGTLVTNLIDTTGAADIDIGSADVTDVTFTTAGGAFVVNGGITSTAAVSDLSVGGLKSPTPTVDDPDNWVMSGAGMYGGIWIGTAAGTGALPAVAAGMNFTVIMEAALVVTLDPNAADTIYLDGAAETQDETIVSSGTVGDMVVCTYRSANAWSCNSSGFDGGTD